jgi:hypothetical protein
VIDEFVTNDGTEAAMDDGECDAIEDDGCAVDEGDEEVRIHDHEHARRGIGVIGGSVPCFEVGRATYGVDDSKNNEIDGNILTPLSVTITMLSGAAP